ncbi:hypothetical protein ACHAXA_009761 [Cyclostephanos tholiformis]|uniref:Uncharacterized protein n=1 Tax=Cyclostephanos tholiformis TaxID=382380 RepID=A0ABD3SGG7_9STRA
MMLEGLEDRLRELNIALGQCRSSAIMGRRRRPHVMLRAHPIMSAAAANSPDNSTDVNASGLSSYLQGEATQGGNIAGDDALPAHRRSRFLRQRQRQGCEVLRRVSGNEFGR